MTQDERAELLQDASDLAYQHIRFSGLWRWLTNEEWEQLAAEHAEQIVRLLGELANKKLTQIESEDRELKQWILS